MPQSERETRRHLQHLLAHRSPEDLIQRLAPKLGSTSRRIPGATITEPYAVERRWDLLNISSQAKSELWDFATAERHQAFARNIENLIGTVKVPVGLAGPLRVNGLFAQGDYYVPLATTEAALVASYSRGAMVITEAGGCSAALVAEGVNRTPGFAFETITEVGLFVSWLLEQTHRFPEIVAKTTRHGSLTDIKIVLEGNHVYVQLEYLTGDAAGQNMVTLATDAICHFISEEAPIQPKHAFLEANLSGDKKASAQSFQNVRGRKVSAEVKLSPDLVKRRLHTSVETMEAYWRMSALGGVMSGTIGVQGHYANGLAALYIATGQDAACVSESAVGVTRFERTEDGSLYATVTLPNLIVGTVGGGTSLPSQAACLDIMGLKGTGHAGALAEIAAALALAGELSIIGALSANEFGRAHQKRARGGPDVKSER
jgi:hydroxymethylglutaryl-CoA reductase (NADPH)